MDWIRTGYTTKMRLWSDRPDVTPVRWFRAAEGADVFSEPHAFTSRDWFPEVFKDIPTAIGELPVPRTYDRGVNTVGYPGLNFCGRTGAFLTGGITGVDPEIHTTADGNAGCCFQAAETAADVLLIADHDGDGTVDSDRLFIRDEDSSMAQIPFRGGPVLVPDVSAPGSQVGAAGLVLNCILFTNLDSSDHTINVMFTTVPTGDPWLSNVVVPANGWLRIPCHIPLTASLFYFWADTADVLTYTGTGWIYS